jgi:predicted acyl esterase
MRDGVRLATDLYFPPVLPAAAIAMRTPYGRSNEQTKGAILDFTRRGYLVVAQDCRGTGDSEPDVWDYWVYEPEDGFDFVEWVTQQAWFNGFLFSCGGSYLAQTQWCMAAHPRMSAIAPEVGGLQTTRSTVRVYMLVNAYPRVVGKGANRLSLSLTEAERLIEPETMAGGFFNAPLHSPLPEALLDRFPALHEMPLAEAKRQLWARYCESLPAQRAEILKCLSGVTEFSYVDFCSLMTVFDCRITYGSHAIPSVGVSELCRQFQAPALVYTGWYDWGLNDTLPSWTAFRREARREVASCSRLIIGPSAHMATGYHEGETEHPELRHNHRLNVDLLVRWYEAIRHGTTESWPPVTYYLMGANEWRVASDWPVPEAQERIFFLGSDGTLSLRPPQKATDPDRYTYDPNEPTPTQGGSIVSSIYRAGSIDLSAVQRRRDVLSYSTEPLEHDLDVVGPLRMILFASSSALDTDFVARLSDVFPDRRALQLQNGMLRARYRHLDSEPELLVAGRIYRFEIDMWATANRFKAGHCLRLDISSADFPRFDRNANRGGEPGAAIPALQTIYHDSQHPSHLLVSVLEAPAGPAK